MTRPLFENQWVTVVLLLGMLAAVGWAYTPGLSGGFQFDDPANLAALAGVVDGRSAMEFILSGSAGPLGRPLSLATFLLQPHAWPDAPGVLIRTNVLLHLLNGLLVAWVLLLVGRNRGEDPVRAGYTAVITAGLWSVLPILASTSLMVIQRMTSLSATFMLLGLVAYLLARQNMDLRPRPALTGMSVSLVLATLLAVFSKENGALLPVFALVLELTLLSSPAALHRRTWRMWTGAFLWLPLALIVGFLATQVPYDPVTIQARGFTAWERLLTQSVILWEYLFHAFLPMDLGQLGPFQGGHRIYSSLAQPTTLAATAAWLVAATLAVAFRRRFPVLAFALFWYLGGHLLESTVVPLELYFEHRNYLPLLGPAFAVAWIAVRAPERLRLFTGVAGLAYFALLAVSLVMVTSLWGQPLRAAQEQYRDNPQSPRAVGFLFAHLYALGAFEPAERLVDRAIDDGIRVNRYRVSKLYLACRHGTGAFTPPSPAPVRRGLESGEFDKHLAHALYVLSATRAEIACPVLGLAEAGALLDAAWDNPLYRAHGGSLYWIYRAKARLAQAAGNPDASLRYYHRALEQRFDPELARLVVDLHVESGEIDEACEVIGRIRHQWHWSPTRVLHRHLIAERLLGRIPDSNTGPKCPRP